MLISCIIPTRNRCALLREAVESALCQAEVDVEVVVADDGSTDETRAVFEHDTRIRYVPSPRRGVSAARNAAMDVARGDLLAFLDDDDLWLPDKLRVQVGRMRLEGHRFSCTRSDARYETELRPHNCLGILMAANAISTSTVVVERSLVETVGGFDESLMVAEDWDYWLRLCLRVELLALDESLAVYRTVAERARLTSNDEMNWEGSIVVQERHYPAWSRSTGFERRADARIRASIADKYLALAALRWRAGRRTESWELTRRAIAWQAAYCLRHAGSLAVRRVRGASPA